MPLGVRRAVRSWCCVMLGRRQLCGGVCFADLGLYSRPEVVLPPQNEFVLELRVAKPGRCGVFVKLGMDSSGAGDR